MFVYKDGFEKKLLLTNQINKVNTLNKFNSVRSTAKSCESIFEMFPDLLDQQQKELKQEQQQQDNLEIKKTTNIKPNNREYSNAKTPSLSDMFSQVAVLKSPGSFFKILYSSSKIRYLKLV